MGGGGGGGGGGEEREEVYTVVMDIICLPSQLKLHLTQTFSPPVGTGSLLLQTTPSPL